MVERFSADDRKTGIDISEYDDDGRFVLYDDYAALESRLAELEKDAARYRWLRNLPVGHDDEWIANLTGDHLDSAIDEAMSRES